jgi:adenosylhomocysteine nucleosidase
MRNATFLSTMIFAACWAQPRPIVVQGAMPAETDRFAGRLEHVIVEEAAGWTFRRGTVDGYPVIVSKTGKGAANTAAATALAAERYHPLAIVNEGTAGGHDPELHVYDIVLGKEAVNLGAWKTARREAGQGSDPLQWNPMDLMASEGSAGQDPNALVMRRLAADERLLAAARKAAPLYRKGKVREGVIGSSEVWNSELDRIRLFHERYGTSVEEMETAAAARVAGQARIPFLGIRVVSNNITNGGKYDGKTGEACQDFVFEVVRAYIGGMRGR